MEQLINNNQKTVFFGPFLGEFGWELSFWHGWVKKMCREKYSSYRKIVASYPGREPFYPDADEFWPHPPEVASLKISQRGYISDFWIGNLPEASAKDNSDKNIGQHAERLFKKYREKLPKDTIFYVPYKLNSYQLKGEQHLLGILLLKGLSIYKMPKTLSPVFEHQLFESLEPTIEGREFLKKIINSDKRIIAVFPRYRSSRRTDKNWSRQKYDLLIKNLQKKYSSCTVGIFGAPSGAYYVDGVPEGCVDFINLPAEKRFTVQLAALKQADVAVGSVSGAIRAVSLAQCPAIEWGPSMIKKFAEQENFLKTRFVYWPEPDPSVETIEKLVDLMIQKREKEIVYPVFKEESWRKEKYYKNLFARLVFREIISRPILMYLRSKKLKEGVINKFLLKFKYERI